MRTASLFVGSRPLVLLIYHKNFILSTYVERVILVSFFAVLLSNEIHLHFSLFVFADALFCVSATN